MNIHSIAPLYNKNSKILILGSFPSVKSREQMFFYAHPQNRFWKVISAIFESKVPISVDDKKELLLRSKIALWDVIGSCEMIGSSDSSIKNVKVNDISPILESANIKHVFLNGKTSMKYYKRIEEKNGITAICLPSTSPANAAWSLERLIDAWSIIKEI